MKGSTSDRFDVREIRRKNLIDLLDAYEGFDTRWARKYGLNSKVITQIKNGLRKMGPDIARRIDAALGKPSGWMDQSHDERELSPTALEFAQLFCRLSSEDQHMFAWFIRRVAEEKNKKASG